MALLRLTKREFLNESGIPFAGGNLYVYQSGSFTPVITYGDAFGRLVHSRYPIRLNALGQVDVFASPAQYYRVVLKDAFDQNIVFQDDRVTAGQVLGDGGAPAPPPPPPSGSAAENFVTLTNNSIAFVPRATPVYSNGAGFDVTLASDQNVKRLVGLTTAGSAPGASVSVQMDGVIEVNSAEWFAVTGMIGGVANSNYWVANALGQLSSSPPSGPDPLWSLKVGYGVDNTHFKIEIQPSVKL
jgi:hypothetical protein